MSIEAITNFLGCEPNQDSVFDPERDKHWYYDGENLKYWITLDTKLKIMSISGDMTEPFSYSSLYEVAVPYDKIAIETEPEFYGDQEILMFRKNYESLKNFKTMMIMKWPNGELSVWPYNIVVYQSTVKDWDERIKKEKTKNV